MRILLGGEYTVKGKRANEKWKQERKKNGMKERESVCEREGGGRRGRRF